MIDSQEVQRHQRARNQLVSTLRRKGITNETVLSVMQSAPRHCFIDAVLWHRAYDDNPLPIIASQTISQPYIVAYMTQELINHATSRANVLEVGTGSGYQSYILSQLFDRVYSIERIEALHQLAQQRLADLQCANVRCSFGDGHEGWGDHAPYSAILITAAVSGVPIALIDQLAVDGILIAPVGDHNATQTLVMVQKTEDSYISTDLETVRFVPALTGVVS